MNALWGQLAVLVAALAVAAGAIAGGDRSAFVAPPEMVAEELLKHVVAGRYEPARARLSDDVRPTVSADDLRDLRSAIESRLGRVAEVNGVNATFDEETAQADVELTSADGSRRQIQVHLRRHHGLWFVAGVPSL